MEKHVMVLYMFVLCAYKHGSMYQFQMYQISLGHQISRGQHILSVHKTIKVLTERNGYEINVKQL